MGEPLYLAVITEEIDLILISSAALEMLESDLDTLQQRSELQDAQLLVLREQKLVEVRKAA